MRLTGLRYSHMRDFGLNESFCPHWYFREHSLLYEMSSVPGKISFSAGFLLIEGGFV